MAYLYTLEPTNRIEAEQRNGGFWCKECHSAPYISRTSELGYKLRFNTNLILSEDQLSYLSALLKVYIQPGSNNLWQRLNPSFLVEYGLEHYLKQIADLHNTNSSPEIYFYYGVNQVNVHEGNTLQIDFAWRGKNLFPNTDISMTTFCLNIHMHPEGSSKANWLNDRGLARASRTSSQAEQAYIFQKLAEKIQLFINNGKANAHILHGLDETNCQTFGYKKMSSTRSNQATSQHHSSLSLNPDIDGNWRQKKNREDDETSSIDSSSSGQWRQQKRARFDFGSSSSSSPSFSWRSSGPKSDDESLASGSPANRSGPK